MQISVEMLLLIIGIGVGCYFGIKALRASSLRRELVRKEQYIAELKDCIDEEQRRAERLQFEKELAAQRANHEIGMKDKEARWYESRINTAKEDLLERRVAQDQMIKERFAIADEKKDMFSSLLSQQMDAVRDANAGVMSVGKDATRNAGSALNSLATRKIDAPNVTVNNFKSGDTED